MTDDVRAAADMIVSEHTYCQQHGFTSWDNPTMQAALKLANAYLSEHPPDDSLDVTADWLRSVGAEGLDADAPYFGWADDYGWLLAWYEKTGCLSVRGSTIHVGIRHSRRDVRRLAKALGIELREASNG